MFTLFQRTIARSTALLTSLLPIRFRTQQEKLKFIGVKGESRAHAYLRACGYLIWEKNWKTAYGEVDIIASKGRTLVFVEVKTRKRIRGARFRPIDSVDWKKQQKLRALAKSFVMKNRPALRRAHISHTRFDVISVWYEGEPSVMRFKTTLEHIRQAFY